jgi:hypothetical protein
MNRREITMKVILRSFIVFWLISLFFPSWTGANVGVVNGLTHERIASSGQTYETIVIIKNFSESPSRVKVYQTDFHFYSDGRQIHSEAGKLERSNAGWISYYPKSVVLSAGESAEVKCTVQIPEDDTLCGTYWSLLMVEPVPEVQAELKQEQKAQVSYGITQVVRYAAQIITHIEDSGIRQIKFLDTQFLKEEEKKILQVDVENTGERWLRPILYVELYNEKGDHIGRFEGGKWRIYPGTSVRYRVDLSTLAEGTYKAMIIVDNLDEYVFGAEYSLNIQPVFPWK